MSPLTPKIRHSWVTKWSCDWNTSRNKESKTGWSSLLKITRKETKPSDSFVDKHSSTSFIVDAFLQRICETCYLILSPFFMTSNYSIVISNATYTISDQWCINNYMLYEIPPTCPARGLATQLQVGYVRPKSKISCGGANCSKTNNNIIISLMAPYEFSVIARTTTEEFIILRSYPGRSNMTLDIS